MISLQTNVTSLFAQEQLNTNDNFESNTIEQLTSGYRINNSGDDAAGLAVANGLQAEVAELQQGVINAANGSSILQTMDGGLSNISNLLDRLETLATEGASGTFSGSYTTLNNEFQSVLTEITRQAGNIGLASTTASGGLGTVTTSGTIGASQYNTTPLAVFIGGGDANTATDDQVTIDLTSNGGAGGNGVDSLGLGLSTSDVLNAGDAATALTAIQSAITTLGTVQGKVGAGENLLNYATNLANSQITNLTSSESSIKDANVAAEAANLAKAQTLQQSSIAALAQANSMPEALLKLLQ
ncbi:MAG TPA: flagellin [Bryobacteraceae bacterium]|jgi:flagellin|nr:flagellin [Bryobacteraceae bacterium]